MNFSEDTTLAKMLSDKIEYVYPRSPEFFTMINNVYTLSYMDQNSYKICENCNVIFSRFLAEKHEEDQAFKSHHIKGKQELFKK